MSEKNAVIVVTTAGSRDEAESIASALVLENLGACVQLLDMTSIYKWKGEICRDPEILMLIKSRKALYPLIEDRIRELHSYEVPEILSIPVADGLAAYLDWITDVTGGK